MELPPPPLLRTKIRIRNTLEAQVNSPPPPPSGVRNWSWALTRKILVCGPQRCVRYMAAGACPTAATSKYWECKK